MESLEGFWQQVQTVWESGVFGMSIGDIVIALSIFLGFLFARRIFFRTVTATLRALTRRTKTTLDDLLLEAIENPIEFAFVVVGIYVSAHSTPLPEHASHVLGSLVRSLIAFTIFWAIFRALDPLSVLFDRAIGLFGSTSMHETMKEFFVKLAKFVVVCVGATAVFQEWGFNVAAVLGSLGLVGMAVALGAQDFIKNMFAGLTIFLDRMFEKGNWIKTLDVEGMVEDIGFRATKIRQFDKALVTIPNSKLASEALINFSRMTQRRIYWTIGVEYRTTQEQLRGIVKTSPIIFIHVQILKRIRKKPRRSFSLIHSVHRVLILCSIALPKPPCGMNGYPSRKPWRTMSKRSSKAMVPALLSPLPHCMWKHCPLENQNHSLCLGNR